MYFSFYNCLNFCNIFLLQGHVNINSHLFLPIIVHPSVTVCFHGFMNIISFSGPSNLVRVRAPLSTPTGLRILTPGTVTNTIGGTIASALVTSSITPTVLSPTHTPPTLSQAQLQTSIASPIRVASPQTVTQGQVQLQTQAQSQSQSQTQAQTPGQMSGIQALAAAAAATQKMSTGKPVFILQYAYFVTLLSLSACNVLLFYAVNFSEVIL